MKITIIGGTGWLGAEIAYEAVTRGHEVIVISRNPKDIQYTLTPELVSLKANAANYRELCQAIPDDTDICINAIIPDPFVPETFSQWCLNIIRCCKEKRIRRLAAITDSCIFEVRPGVKLNQTTFLTPFYRTWFGAHEASHRLYLEEQELDWIEIAPAAKCLPDKQLKEYQIAVDRLCSNDPMVMALDTPDPDHYPFADTSYISTQDFAFAVLDELEHPLYHRTRICIAWKENHMIYGKGDTI
ncbi:NAD(P)-dependent oxidoreductase [Diplocloster agilis]|uniref:NAD(P)H-binding protein n=1 Tax=Diplocloster agilis TaxID=2850323 RepID=A0A949K2W2_9FIRM|nr:NAD(P)H-binding protein [Diplocloster agilis]MBU9744893.1 NAD(P)H-binding protein [Diplocloster agilis]